MATNCKKTPIANSDLLSFLKDNDCNTLHFDVLRFVGKHPNARLSLSVLARATGKKKVDLANAIVPLIEQDILAACQDDNGVTTFSLSSNLTSQCYILKLAGLDWSAAGRLRKKFK